MSLPDHPARPDGAHGTPGAARATSTAAPIAARAAAVAGVIAALLTPLGAHASGNSVVDEFVTRSRTEIPLDRFGRGELGIVLPTYSRVMLYPAWRAIASADAGRPLVAVPADALERGCCDNGTQYNGDWEAEKRPAIAAWLAARGAVVTDAPRWRPVRMKRVPNKDWQDFLNCGDDAYQFAADTLTALRRRDDATPARLGAWIETQDRVFGHCGDKNSPRYGAAAREAPVPPPPPIEPLPDSEPGHWRQARGYQRAAAAFYASDFPAADSLFSAIARREGHAWQAWAALAEMRTQLRLATLGPAMGLSRTDLVVVPRMEALAANIAAHPDWTVQQRAARELIQIARSRFEPARQLARLTRALSDLDRAPEPQPLVDWRLVAEAVPVAERGKLPILDWVETMASCARPDPATRPTPRPDVESWPTRSQGFGIAVARWRTAPDRALWLVPALACADGAKLGVDRALRHDLMTAADRVPATHPAWLTIRWQQVRLLREAGDSQGARERLTPLVTGQVAQAPTPSARNQIAQEALWLARTPEEALPWLQREYGNWARYVFAQEPQPRTSLAADGARLLSERFTLTDLLRAVQSPLLAPPLRAQLAYGLWWRADLLAQPALAREAAQALAAAVPNGDALVAPYLRAQTPAARRAALWRASLQGRALSAQMQSGLGGVTAEGLTRTSAAGEAVANQWCRLDDTYEASEGWPANGQMAALEEAPPLPADFPVPAGLANERAALKAAGSATGAFARWVLAESRRPDRPADLDWLLYVGIQSTRGGCVDADNSASSKAMYMALHKLYPKSPWATKAKVWY
ncbi:hypothetical protein CDN99_09375 [Roseateles aquatilis]|uniref:Uncharacterized protein n=1 Tax=Roseateles aquatilis TaxID=431061 RepID=A0A246JGJ0_9BURK|nr:hypothetical protein [Roseateles aquatilis]OWQ91367.1 hypothetical protein CDN99_09375 [Roseateles aquatilis]